MWQVFIVSFHQRGNRLSGVTQPAQDRTVNWQEGWNPSLSDSKPGFSPLFEPGLALRGDPDQITEPL